MNITTNDLCKTAGWYHLENVFIPLEHISPLLLCITVILERTQCAMDAESVPAWFSYKLQNSCQTIDSLQSTAVLETKFNPSEH
jgi:hypothetical protein